MNEAMTPVTAFSAMPSLHYGGLAVARTLGRLGAEVHWIHPMDATSALSSRYVTTVVPISPGLAPSEALRHLHRTAVRIGRPPLLVPLDDAAAVIVADHADELREEFIFPTQQPELARALSDKKSMHDLCVQHGVPTPQVAVPASRDELEAFLSAASLPLVVKRISNSRDDGVDRPNVIIAETVDEVRAAFSGQDWNLPTNGLLQEYLPGGPETIWMFDGYFDGNAELVFGVVARKLRQAPPYTGVTTLGVCEDQDELLKSTSDFLTAIGYVGVIDLGYRWDARDGVYKMLDINPRVGATFRLFSDSADFDVVRAMYADLTGATIPRGAPVPGRRWLLEPSDVISSIRYGREGRLSFAEWWRSVRGVDERGWYARDDLRPFWAMMRNSLRRGVPILRDAMRS